MDKYTNMTNPPRFNGEWKKWAFFILDLIILIACFFWTKGINVLFHLPIIFALLNYLLWFVIGLIIVWRPINNPGQRQIFAIIESLVFTDKNHYHALDPNRNYHH